MELLQARSGESDDPPALARSLSYAGGVSRGRALHDELSMIVEVCALQCAALRMLLTVAGQDDMALVPMVARLDQVEAAAREARRNVGLLMDRSDASNRR